MTNRPRGSSSDLPKWLQPQLCKLVEAPPQGPDWLHEIKYDGYRMHARLDHGTVSLLTRSNGSSSTGPAEIEAGPGPVHKAASLIGRS